jgi:hypothetical protein
MSTSRFVHKLYPARRSTKYVHSLIQIKAPKRPSWQALNVLSHCTNQQKGYSKHNKWWVLVG